MIATPVAQTTEASQLVMTKETDPPEVIVPQTPMEDEAVVDHATLTDTAEPLEGKHLLYSTHHQPISNSE